MTRDDLNMTVASPFRTLSLDLNKQTLDWNIFSSLYHGLITTNITDDDKATLNSLQPSLSPRLFWSINCGIHLKLGNKKFYPCDLTSAKVQEIKEHLATEKVAISTAGRHSPTLFADATVNASAQVSHQPLSPTP